MIEFVDIAGLVKGASKGEGLGNQFLSNIREVDAIVHVVRCFEDSNVVHVDGSVNPLRDIETIETELLLADIQGTSKRHERMVKMSKGDKDARVAADEMARLADQVICFENGRIVAEGPLEEVLLERWPGQGEQGSSVVLSGVVTERSEMWCTAVVTAGETAFEVPDAGRNVGEAARLRILARDVSVALSEPRDTSIRNVLPAVVIGMRGVEGESHVMLTLEAGGCRILSRITRRSADELGIAVGTRLYAQVKAAAIIV